ncbi:unnamed protein product [Allacma fusca]|uniref:Zinc finger PHD-type domain-containing protein n=1 Tax=Allacma fusca TaxID=39272 RepID=A0A8J2Q264_9HEXA|nr:unnamed protein product [Allacma fusca]
MFIRNCDNLKVLFLREVNEITGILPSPKAHSTPKPARNQSDRCGFCLGFADANWVQCTRCPTWYYALCLRIDFKKVETDAHCLCPKCTDLPHESFPSRFVPQFAD